MKFKGLLPLFLLITMQNTAFSQAEIGQSSEKASNALTEYFKLDRENIHLHLNKNTFLTHDEIWFKGYIIEKKSKKGYLPTSNVHVAMFDEKGTKIKTHLFLAENSSFEGNIKLDESMSTGSYYLQVYTNYMNNFTEDESSVFEIKIINPNDGKTIPNNKIINTNTITTDFFPESSIFLEGTSNTIAVKITDCNGNGLSIKDGEIKDSKGTTVTNFNTNGVGYGKFEIVQTKKELYKAVFKIDNIKTEINLPMPIEKGITLSANNYTFEDKTTLKIKTNTISLADYKNESLTLVIQQDNYSSFIPFSLNENNTGQLFTLPNENFKPGINTLYLIDKNQKKIAERILYKPFDLEQKINLKVLRKQNDSIIISGTSTLPMGTLSVSVLPNETKTLTNKKSIFNSFILDNHLSEKTPNGNYFLSDFSKNKHSELDTYLMCQKSKYNWETMLTSPPQNKFEFDSGLTIKGTINVPVKDRDSKVQMKSIVAGLNELSDINDKNEFYFKNILVYDSTTVHFSLLNKKNQSTEIKSVPQIVNNNRHFNKPLKNKLKNCSPTITENNNYSFPKTANTIQLESMSIFTKKRSPKFTNIKRFNNDKAKAFKILDVESDRDILQFIAANGFTVSVDSIGNVIIIGQKPSSWLGTREPLIYWDDAPVLDFNQLRGWTLRYIDEIYINKNGYGGGMDAANGIIRIHSKKGSGGARQIKINSQAFTVKNGFQKTNHYRNPEYTSYTDEGFKNFGNIHWDPGIETDKNGVFTFSIPNYDQKSIKVIIEGIGTDGQLISETKTIEIP